MTEEQLTIEWKGLIMAGSLHLPDSDGSHPVVVMMQGSGPSDRTGNGYFPTIRDAFLARGLATFAFDKPGCGDSTGDWRDHGLNDRADQVVTVVNSLRRHPLIRDDGIGVWGQSQGGWLAQMLAGRMTDLAFAIANSGPTLNVPSQDLYGCEHEMRANGHPEEEVERALAFIADLHEAARKETPYEAVKAQILDPAEGQPWNVYLTVDDAADWRHGAIFVTEEYEPLDAIRRARCPFLAVYGGRDVLLPPWQSAIEAGQALQQAGLENCAVVVFPNGDHRIQTDGTFVAGYLDLIADWAAGRFG